MPLLDPTRFRDYANRLDLPPTDIVLLLAATGQMPPTHPCGFPYLADKAYVWYTHKFTEDIIPLMGIHRIRTTWEDFPSRGKLESLLCSIQLPQQIHIGCTRTGWVDFRKFWKWGCAHMKEKPTLD